MEFITGENQGSFLLTETLFWQEIVVECKHSSTGERNEESALEMGFQSKLHKPNVEYNFSCCCCFFLPRSYPAVCDMT